jgi:branched-chain amino acid transport system substrate-binding protein
MLIADFLERAKSTDPDAIVEAMKATSYAGGLMQYGGPIHFNELGDNPNAVPTMIQILGQKPVAVWPKDAAVQKFVFPRPKA